MDSAELTALRIQSARHRFERASLLQKIGWLLQSASSSLTPDGVELLALLRDCPPRPEANEGLVPGMAKLTEFSKFHETRSEAVAEILARPDLKLVH